MSEPVAQAAPAAPAGKKSKLKVAIIVGIVVAVQCVLAFLFFPSGDSTAKADSKKDKAAKAGEHGDEHGKAADTREADLGAFSLTTFNPNSNSTLVIDFHLYGAVAVEHEESEGKPEAAGGHGEKKEHGEKGGGEPEDASKFGKLFKKSKHRFRDQVIVVIRNAEMADLSDPGLGLIKRQILAKTNSLLGEPLLKEVMFSEFSVVEQ